jgi:uncharacterized repeat protein (TIGR01451 family)
VTGKGPNDEPVDDTDDATVPGAQGPAISLAKDAQQDSYNAVGDILNYTMVAKNIGNVVLHDVSISDPLLPSLSCTPAQPATLAPGASMTCTGSYTVTQGDLDAGSVDNTATVTGKGPNDEPVDDTDDATVPAAQGPAISLAKSAEEETYTFVGDLLNYTLVAKNTGNVVLHDVSISDPKLGTLVCTPNQPATLAPGESMTCTGSYAVTQGDLDAGQVDNTATVTGKDPNGESVSDTDDATVAKTTPTGETPEAQPSGSRTLFLPSLQSNVGIATSAVAASVTAQPDASSNIYLPSVESN